MKRLLLIVLACLFLGGCGVNHYPKPKKETNTLEIFFDGELIGVLYNVVRYTTSNNRKIIYTMFEDGSVWNLVDTTYYNAIELKFKAVEDELVR